MKVGLVQIVAFEEWDCEQRIHCCLLVMIPTYSHLAADYAVKGLQDLMVHVQHIRIYYYGQGVDLAVAVVVAVVDTYPPDICASVVVLYLKAVDYLP